MTPPARRNVGPGLGPDSWTWWEEIPEPEPETCPECGSKVHFGGECWGKPGFEDWSHWEIWGHYAD